MLSPSEQRIWQLFTEIGLLDQIGRTAAEAALVSGLSLAQFGLLNHLSRLGGEWSPVRLARTFHVTKQTMTSTLARLQRQGYVRIRPDPADGRAKLVALTAEGAAVHSVCLARMGPAMAVAADAVPEGLVEMLLPKLVTLKDALGQAGAQAGAQEGA
jgi:DNA-binding MarR family transcriptional regulator